MKAVWLSIGLLALVLGTVGIFLPLLPTTPFLLVAAFALARSSDRLHDWLVTHRLFGPLIDDWRRHGAISTRTKCLAVVSMAVVLLLSVILDVDRVVLIIQAIALSCAAVFVLTRPSPPQR